MLGGSDYKIYEYLLQVVPQEKVFQLIGLPPTDGYIRNVLRNDSTPGCFFKYKQKELLFYDYTKKLFNKRAVNCFEALEYKLNLQNHPNKYKLVYEYLKSLDFLRNTDFVNSKSVMASLKSLKHATDNKIIIKVKIKPWSEKHYLSITGATNEELVKESVYLVKDYYANTSRDPLLRKNRFNNPYKETTICYKYADRKKLYFPGNELKFYGNVLLENIHGIDGVTNSPLVITKSVKDYLCLKYGLKLNSLATTLENKPLTPKLYDLVELRKSKNLKTYILWDNDNPGIESGNKLASQLEIPVIYYPKIDNSLTDTFDFFQKFGIETTKKCLINALKNLKNGD